MDLDPDYSTENLSEFGIKGGLTLLRELINNSNSPSIRKRALENFGRIDDKKNFKFFEQLFLSDEDSNIQLIAGCILRENYSTSKKILRLLEYALRNIDNIEQKIFSIKTLNSINSSNSHKVLVEFMKDFIKKVPKNSINEFPKEIYSHSIKDPIPESLINICINLILYNYYLNQCRYLPSLRNGEIISLICESSNLNSITEIEGLSNLYNLEHLSLQRNHIKKIKLFPSLKKLKSLTLSYNFLEKMENLERLENLEELNLSNNRIVKIENLNSLIKLKKLSIDGNLITIIENLDSLRELEALNLSQNLISEMNNLGKLGKLKRINLSFNQIRKIADLKGLKELMWIYLTNNKISKIEGLITLDKLRGLYLSNNLIERIESLDNLINLRKLELSHNNIKNLNGISNLKELKELYLDNNNINELKGLDKLKKLIILHIGRNNILKYRSESIKNLNNLNFLFLNENPLDQESWEQYMKKFRF